MQGLQRHASLSISGIAAGIAAGIIFFTGIDAQAASYAAIADTYTRGDKATSNFGSSADLRTNRWNDVTALARFNLGSGSSIDSARLRISVDAVKSGGTVYVHRVLEPWDENSTSHKNLPKLGPAIASFSVAGSDSGRTISVEATRVAKELLSNGSQNFGIAFTTSNAKLHIDSRESGSPMRLEISGSSSGGSGSSGGSSGGSNNPPSIAGDPARAVNAGSGYDFRPDASDPDNDELRFSITNKPSWASFSRSSGRLYGAPGFGDVGHYRNMSITVSDGEDTATLGPFDIEVAQGGNDSVTLSWQIPTQNTDGSHLRDLDAFRIRWSRRGSSAQSSIKVNNPSVSTYVVENLSPGTYEFSVEAINARGVSSTPSNEVTAIVN